MQLLKLEYLYLTYETAFKCLIVLEWVKVAGRNKGGHFPFPAML